MAQLRITNQTREMLREMARLDGVTMQSVLDKALAEYQKKQFFDTLEAGFQALKNDRKAWNQERQDCEAWESALLDNVEPNEIWTEDGNVFARS